MPHRLSYRTRVVAAFGANMLAVACAHRPAGDTEVRAGRPGPLATCDVPTALVVRNATRGPVEVVASGNGAPPVLVAIVQPGTETVPVPPRPGLQYFGRVRDANENMGKARYVPAVRIEPRCEVR